MDRRSDFDMWRISCVNHAPQKREKALRSSMSRKQWVARNSIADGETGRNKAE